MSRITAFLVFAILFATGQLQPAWAGDRLGLRIGMSPAEADAAMEGRCKDQYVSLPYLTCVNGGFIVTAIMTKKDRLSWARMMEQVKDDPESYAKVLAAELGFSGDPSPCVVADVKTFCFRMPDGTVLGAASTEYDGYLTSYLFNDQIVTEDGGNQ